MSPDTYTTGINITSRSVGSTRHAKMQRNFGASSCPANSYCLFSQSSFTCLVDVNCCLHTSYVSTKKTDFQVDGTRKKSVDYDVHCVGP